MEFADRGDLSAVIRNCKDSHTTIDEKTVAGWLVQIVAALKHLHTNRVLHRDLKTQNIFLTGPEPGIIKLGDFGIAKVRSPQGGQQSPEA